MLVFAGLITAVLVVNGITMEVLDRLAKHARFARHRLAPPVVMRASDAQRMKLNALNSAEGHHLADLEEMGDSADTDRTHHPGDERGVKTSKDRTATTGNSKPTSSGAPSGRSPASSTGRTAHTSSRIVSTHLASISCVC